MPINALAAAIVYRNDVPYPPWPFSLFCVLLLAARLTSSARAAPYILSEQARDLHGRIILVLGAFNWSGFTVFTSLAKRGARLIALCPAPIGARETQLLHLATVASNNEQLFIESCDLTSVKDVRRFANDWEKKAAVRRGALGEEIGRQHLDTLLLMPPDGSDEFEILELTRALAPCLVKATSVPGAASRASNTRIVYVLPSSIYAAADALDSIPQTRSMHKAYHSLVSASRFIEFSRQQDEACVPTQNKLSVIAVSPGTTRHFLLSMLWPTDQNQMIIKLGWYALMVVLYPLVWAVGKSARDVSRTVEWAVLAPLDSQENAKIPPVRSGTLYRNTIDAGCALRIVTDRAVARKLYEEDEARIKKTLLAETRSV